MPEFSWCSPEEHDLIGAAAFELGMTPSEIMQTLIGASVKTGNPKYRDLKLYLKDKYVYPMVSCTQWMGDPFYSGMVAHSMFDLVRQDFLSIMEANPRPLRVILGGGIGWGKTFLSNVIFLRILYELGCMRSPQNYYGLHPTSYITFMNMSVAAMHARRVFFAGLRDMVDGAPWFRQYFQRDRMMSVLHWPQKFVSFVPGSSSILAPLGQNLFGGVIEEANAFQISEHSRKIRDPGEREWDQAKKITDAVWRRMKSRYQNKGRMPGMLVLNSSAEHVDDFLEKLKRENDPHTMVIEHATWETKPQHQFSGKKFYCFVGDSVHAPKILHIVEDKPKYEAIGKVVAVPEEYRDDFERNIEGAIRDIAGCNVRSINRFMTQDDRLRSIVDASIPVPFGDRFKDGIGADELEGAVLYEKLVTRKRDKSGKLRLFPVLHPDAPRFIHIDLGLSTDATGFCITHVSEMIEVQRRREDQEKGIYVTREVVPVVYVDAVLRIIPPLEGEVQIDDVRNLIYEFQERCGFRYQKITYDQFQSKHSQQILEKRYGEDIVGYLSVDRKADQYHVLKETIYEGRLKCYGYIPLLRELATLQYNARTKKVDHLPNGSKDVADALAGAVWNAVSNMEVGMRSAPSFQFPETEESIEQKLAREAQEWLLDVIKVKSKDDDDAEFEQEAMEQELREMDDEFDSDKENVKFSRGW